MAGAAGRPHPARRTARSDPGGHLRPRRSGARGRLPAAVVAGNPEFLRPLVGIEPSGGAHLRFYGVDVGRSPDGRWWVLGDRTQAPSGAGYALENRLALSRAMPDIYRAASRRARRAVLPGVSGASCRRSAAATIPRSAC